MDMPAVKPDTLATMFTAVTATAPNAFAASGKSVPHLTMGSAEIFVSLDCRAKSHFALAAGQRRGTERARTYYIN